MNGRKEARKLVPFERGERCREKNTKNTHGEEAGIVRDVSFLCTIAVILHLSGCSGGGKDVCQGGIIRSRTCRIRGGSVRKAVSLARTFAFVLTLPHKKKKKA